MFEGIPGLPPFSLLDRWLDEWCPDERDFELWCLELLWILWDPDDLEVAPDFRLEVENDEGWDWDEVGLDCWDWDEVSLDCWDWDEVGLDCWDWDEVGIDCWDRDDVDLDCWDWEVVGLSCWDELGLECWDELDLECCDGAGLECLDEFDLEWLVEAALEWVDEAGLEWLDDVGLKELDDVGLPDFLESILSWDSIVKSSSEFSEWSITLLDEIFVLFGSGWNTTDCCESATSLGAFPKIISPIASSFLEVEATYFPAMASCSQP